MTDLAARLDTFRSATPGLQYVILGPCGRRTEIALGLADVRSGTAMTLATTQMAYSMTKTFTAVAILQLVERGHLHLDDPMDDFLPDTPYRGRSINVRHLLTHTAGLPNPIPLRWVHLIEESGHFDEAQALARIVQKHSRLVSLPGQRYFYSNLGYWLLGRIIERVTRQPYVDYVRSRLLELLGLSAGELGFSIADQNLHAKGYLARFSLVNLLKGLVTDPKFWGDYEGPWLHVKNHYLDGPSFGGLVGTARAFACFLQDQLAPESKLLSAVTRQLLETPQTTSAGTATPMTPGWHIRARRECTYLFKEGGGGGFHSEMRLYRREGIASVVLANNTGFPSTRFLDKVDAIFLRDPSSIGSPA